MGLPWRQKEILGCTVNAHLMVALIPWLTPEIRVLPQSRSKVLQKKSMSGQYWRNMRFMETGEALGSRASEALTLQLWLVATAPRASGYRHMSAEIQRKRVHTRRLWQRSKHHYSVTVGCRGGNPQPVGLPCRGRSHLVYLLLVLLWWQKYLTKATYGRKKLIWVHNSRVHSIMSRKWW